MWRTFQLTSVLFKLELARHAQPHHLGHVQLEGTIMPTQNIGGDYVHSHYSIIKELITIEACGWQLRPI